MDEILTTGQLIDRLKAWEVAMIVEDPNGMVEGQKIYNDGHKFLWVRGNSLFNIHDGTRCLKWRILPKLIQYATFKEAINAYFDGKEIILHNDFGCQTHFIDNGTGFKVKLEFVDYINGKWEVVQ